MEVFIPVLITLVAMGLLAMAYAMGYRRGYGHGCKKGRGNAVTALLRTKDPEAWDKARFLEVEAEEAELERQAALQSKIETRIETRKTPRKV